MNEQMIKISASLDCANYLGVIGYSKVRKGGSTCSLGYHGWTFVPNYALGTNL